MLRREEKRLPEKCHFRFLMFLLTSVSQTQNHALQPVTTPFNGGSFERLVSFALLLSNYQEVSTHLDSTVAVFLSI